MMVSRPYVWSTSITRDTPGRKENEGASSVTKEISNILPNAPPALCAPPTRPPPWKEEGAEYIELGLQDWWTPERETGPKLLRRQIGDQVADISGVS